MLPNSELAKVLAKVPNDGIAGWYYRAVSNSALYRNDPPNALYALGPGRGGQRYTQVGGPPALYVADQPYTAFAEGTHSITSSLAGLIEPPDPQVVFAIYVKLERMLDLTDDTILKALDTDRAELQGPWADQVLTGIRVPTHDIAAVAYASHRFQGIRFDSKENPGGKNLIIWTNKVRTPSYVEVYDSSKKLAARIPKAKPTTVLI